jgi:anaerobic magnesium-protoporphyrin IX monomethyl ester cyclase
MAIEKMSVREGIKKILSLQPRSIGVSLLEDSKTKGLSLIQDLRRSGYNGPIIVGGYFATFSAQEILRDFPEIDFVVRGEGELTLVELLKNIFRCSYQTECSYTGILGLSFRKNGQIVENPARPLIENLDILPPVDRKYANLVLNRGSRLRIYGTRGCWGQCTFCDIIKLYSCSPGRVWRYRTITNLVDEIESLEKQFHTNYFVFNDDQFLIKGVKGRQRVEEFAAELERRKMNIQFELMCRADTIYRETLARLKSVGLRRVFLGLESFDEKQLQRFGKRVSVRQNLKALITLYQLRIDVIASVILADAYTTLGDLVKQFIFLFELRRRYFNSQNCQISVNKKIELYRGSAIYKDYKKKGLLTKDHYLKEYKYKLKFWTHIRLNLFSLETFFSRVVLNPIQFLNYLGKAFDWQFKQITKDLLLSKS